MNIVNIFFSTSFAQKCKVIYERGPKSNARYITLAVPTHKGQNTGNFVPYSFRIVCGRGSLTSHMELINWKVSMRRDLRFIVLIREYLKV